MLLRTNDSANQMGIDGKARHPSYVGSPQSALKLRRPRQTPPIVIADRLWQHGKPTRFEPAVPLCGCALHRGSGGGDALKGWTSLWISVTQATQTGQYTSFHFGISRPRLHFRDQEAQRRGGLNMINTPYCTLLLFSLPVLKFSKKNKCHRRSRLYKLWPTQKTRW